MTWTSALWKRRDLLIAVAVGVGLCAELAGRADAQLGRTIPIAVTAAVALFFRRTYPVPAFIACWLCLFGLAATVRAFDNESTTFVIAYFVSIFSLGAHTRGREVVASVLLVIIGIATFGVTDGDEFTVGNVAFATFFVGGPWATGLARG